MSPRTRKNELDFQFFAKELCKIFYLPPERINNTEENPLKWDYEVAKHFYNLGRKKEKLTKKMSRNMAQYIKKEDVLTEINSLIDSLKKHSNSNVLGNEQECITAAEIEALELVRDSVNELNVKELNC